MARDTVYAVGDHGISNPKLSGLWLQWCWLVTGVRENVFEDDVVCGEMKGPGDLLSLFPKNNIFHLEELFREASCRGAEHTLETRNRSILDRLQEFAGTVRKLHCDDRSKG